LAASQHAEGAPDDGVLVDMIRDRADRGAAAAALVDNPMRL